MRIKNISKTTISFGHEHLLRPGDECTIGPREQSLVYQVNTKQQIDKGLLEIIREPGDKPQTPNLVRGDLVFIRNKHGGPLTVFDTVLYPGDWMQVESKDITTGPVARSIANGLLEIMQEEPEAEPAEEPTAEP